MESIITNPVLYSSIRHDWETPTRLYQYLDSLYEFDFDPCPVNPDFDGLVVEWGDSNFVNPPYGKYIKAWIKKAYEVFLMGKRSVLLIPARTDTTYWHDYIMKSSIVWLIRGRIKFKGANNSAPFPSAIVLFDPEANGLTTFKTFNYREEILHNGKTTRYTTTELSAS